MTDTWISPRIWVTSERVGQSKMNEISNNLRVLWPHTTSGDMAYRNAAGAYLTRLALGSQHTFLKSNGTTPEYGSLVYRRQGGSSTVWGSPGTTNYTPTTALVQVGAINITVTAGAGSQAITYPVAFSERPAILLSVNANSAALSYSWGISWTDDTISGFTAHIKFSGSFSGTAPINWMSVGA